MEIKDFERTLMYCIYICTDDLTLAELNGLQINYILNSVDNKDIKKLKAIEKDLRKQLK